MRKFSKIGALFLALCLLAALSACADQGAAGGSNTGSASGADDKAGNVQLTELDESSQFEMLENGSRPVVELRQGGLFFNAVEPPADGLEIHFGVMAADIQGQAGWVQAESEQNLQVFLLEGEATVRINLTNGRLLTAELSAGQKAGLWFDEAGEGHIVVQEFGRDLLPPLVQAELAQDEALAALVEALPESAPEVDLPEQWLAATLFEPVNPGLHLERSIVEMPGREVEVYFEIPVFEDEGAAYAEINGFFRGLRDDFLGEAGRELLNDIWQMSEPPYVNTTPYLATWSAKVTAWDEKYISVTISYDWYMGGVLDYGLDAYVFDAQTGRRLHIDEVIAGSEAEIKDMIEAALIDLEPGFAQEQPDIMGETTLGRMRAHTLAEFDFYIEDGQVRVAFDKYEIAAGAAGGFGVTLPANLK